MSYFFFNKNKIVILFKSKAYVGFCFYLIQIFMYIYYHLMIYLKYLERIYLFLPIELLILLINLFNSTRSQMSLLIIQIAILLDH